MARWSTIVTYAVCGAAMAVFALLFLRLSPINEVGAAVVVFFWTSMPHIFLCGAARFAASRTIAAMLIAIGALITAPLGFYLMQDVLLPLPPGVRNCGGPIPFIIVPPFQSLAALLVVVFAGLSRSAFSSFPNRSRGTR